MVASFPSQIICRKYQTRVVRFFQKTGFRFCPPLWPLFVFCLYHFVLQRRHILAYHHNLKGDGHNALPQQSNEKLLDIIFQNGPHNSHAEIHIFVRMYTDTQKFSILSNSKQQNKRKVVLIVPLLMKRLPNGYSKRICAEVIL